MTKILGLIALLTSTPARAQQPAAPEDPGPAPEMDQPQSALGINVIGPAAAATLTALAAATSASGELPIRLRMIDLNLRGHHMFTPKMGLTAQVDYTSLRFVTDILHVGGRAGLRFSPGEQGLSGWALSPYLLGGVTRSGAVPLSRWGVLGLGAEASRSWVWEHLRLELGLGAYRASNLGYTPLVWALEDAEAPEAMLPIKPQLLAGVGYAF